MYQTQNLIDNHLRYKKMSSYFIQGCFLSKQKRFGILIKMQNLLNYGKTDFLNFKKIQFCDIEKFHVQYFDNSKNTLTLPKKSRAQKRFQFVESCQL